MESTQHTFAMNLKSISGLGECRSILLGVMAFGTLSQSSMPLEPYQIPKTQELAPSNRTILTRILSNLPFVHLLQFQQPLLIQIPQNHLHRLFHARLPTPDHHLRVLRFFIRRTYPCKLLDLSSPRLRIQSLRIPLLRLLNRNLYITFDKC